MEQEICTRITVEQCHQCWEVVLWYTDVASGEVFTTADDAFPTKREAISQARSDFNDNPTATSLSVGMAWDFGRQRKVLRSR